MMCITLAIIVLKFLTSIPQEWVNLALGGWGTIQCLILSLFLGVLQFPTRMGDVGKILATAILFFLGQAFITSALKYEKAGPVGMLRVTEVPFAFIWQFLFLNVTPDLYRYFKKIYWQATSLNCNRIDLSCVFFYFSIFGAVLIMSGVFITLFTKWRKKGESDED